MARIPALSIKQPWAWLVVSGQKTMEIRTWKTDYRGPIWIHAGKGLDDLAQTRLNAPIAPRGGFVGMVTICDILELSREFWSEYRPFHRCWWSYQENAQPVYGWLFHSPIQFEKCIPAKGRLGLFYPTSKELEQLMKEAKE